MTPGIRIDSHVITSAVIAVGRDRIGSAGSHLRER